MVHVRQVCCYVSLLLYLMCITSSSAHKGVPRSPEQRQGGVGELFSIIDVNRDGQIEPQEARSYLGDLQVGEQDLLFMQANLDSADQGEYISETELQRHLQSLLKVFPVLTFFLAISLDHYCGAAA